MRRVAWILAAVLSLLIAAYIFYTTTPFYAFQEAALAAQRHDLQAFEQRVDVAGFVQSLLNDVFVLPASNTPGLTPFQREVGNSAISMAKSKAETELIERIERAIAANGNVAPPKVSYWSQFGMQPAMAQEGDDQGKGLLNLVKTAANAVSNEVGKLKSSVYERMLAYARTHRKTIPGRFLGCRSDERVFELRALQRELGLFPETFKGVSSYNCSTNANGQWSSVGLSFFSSKVHRPITIEIELHKEGTFDPWRIMRISNVRDVLIDVGEDYENDVHNLVSASLAGISAESAKTEVHSLTERIKQSDAAQSFMKQWGIKTHNH